MRKLHILLNDQNDGAENQSAKVAAAARLRWRRIKILLAFPAAAILAGLLFAEFENVLAARLVVQATRHPILGLVGLLGGFFVLLVIASIVRGAIRIAIPPIPGDRHVGDQVARWIRGGPNEAEVLRSLRHVDSVRSLPTSTRRTMILMPLALIALAAIVGLVAYETTFPSYARHYKNSAVLNQGPTELGHCSPGPCAVESGTTVYVSSVQNYYLPSDLPPNVYAVQDGGAPLGGHRWVRVVVRIVQQRGSRPLALNSSLELLDGQALHRPDALSFDPACHNRLSSVLVGPGQAGGVPLCYSARAPGQAGGLYLQWFPSGVKIPIGS